MLTTTVIDNKEFLMIYNVVALDESLSCIASQFYREYGGIGVKATHTLAVGPNLDGHSDSSRNLLGVRYYL